MKLAKELVQAGVAAKLLIDSAVAYAMDEVDMVFVGADGVVESGGIINMMGTYQIALVAHSMNKPVYVAAECYKVLFHRSLLFVSILFLSISLFIDCFSWGMGQFARLYPLDQKDLAPALRPVDFGMAVPAGAEVEMSARDYTPPEFLTLLFTDLGVLTPSAVSDELIKLYL